MEPNDSIKFKTLSVRLQDEFETRRTKNALYSLRAFSRDLNVSFSILSRILNGKIPFTEKFVLRIAGTLPLRPDELKYYSTSLDTRKKIRKLASLTEIDPSILQEPAGSITLRYDRNSIAPTLEVIESFLATLHEELKNQGQHEASYNLRISLFKL